jgi:CRISPR/Cas system-associated exonuclease Cas4 (RecB family)
MSNLTWSFSQLKKFLTCARQYHEVKVLGNFSEPETDAMRYGKEVHAAAENYVKHGTPLPEFYKVYQKAIDTLGALPGTKHLEKQMALKRNYSVCDFEDPARWVRGIADFISIDGDTAFSVDYKTGSSKYADLRQLRLMALMIFAHFPEVNYIKSGLMFLANNQFMPDNDWTRDDRGRLWAQFIPDITRMEKAFDTDFWPPNNSGLCKKHCVVTSCAFNGRYVQF